MCVGVVRGRGMRGGGDLLASDRRRGTGSSDMIRVIGCIETVVLEGQVTGELSLFGVRD